MNTNPVVANIKERIANREFKSREELLILINTIKNDPRFNGAISEGSKQELLNLYDKTNSIEEVPKLGDQPNYENIIADLEKKINNNEFTTKTELLDYINKLKSNGIPNTILTEEKVTHFLDLYDTLNPEIYESLDLEEYLGAKLADKNVIISSDGVILKTDKSDMPEDFKENQNELTATNTDGLANANETFEYMRNYKKEELNTVPISEAINRDNIDVELLSKIRFFVTNKKNPKEYEVDLEYGIFYNIETKEVYEVRKNEETGEYEIFKGGQKAYDSSPTSENEPSENELTSETDEEKLTTENEYKKNNGKVRRLVKPKENNLGNAAFVQGGLLFIICIVVGIILSLILFIHK